MYESHIEILIGMVNVWVSWFCAWNLQEFIHILNCANFIFTCSYEIFSTSYVYRRVNFYVQMVELVNGFLEWRILLASRMRLLNVNDGP